MGETSLGGKWREKKNEKGMMPQKIQRLAMMIYLKRYAAKDTCESLVYGIFMSKKIFFAAIWISLGNPETCRI